MEAPPRVCVVVPTYNERENVQALVDSIDESKLHDLSVLFVDDSSPDGTAEEVRKVAASKPWVRILVRENKKGIGTAYQDGFKEAVSKTGATILVEMDADLQHPASALPGLIQAVSKGADVAVASRYVEGGGSSGWSWWRRLVSRGANAYARTLLRLPVRDATSGFRAYNSQASVELAKSRLPAKGFEFQVAALYHLKRDFKIVEVPYVFVTRKAGKSKLRLWDTIRFFFAVIRISMG
ncbi:MAG TPA: polyprenol monophosphomannose synthase [Nitrososphaerales archaeon]|nr:polyprenol monophosphomannose synthase [Nitrososphaerales archaeon]